MREEIQFLKEFQNELKTQEHDSQAAPRFWAIRDYKWIPTSEDHADRVILFDSDACETIEIEEYIEHVEERAEDGEFTSEEVEELKEQSEYGSVTDVYDWIEQHDDKDKFYPIYETEVDFIAWNTLFFTKAEAKRHLELNKHHYSSKAHTFAMTAWRAPKMERLMKILETFDWDSVKV